MWFILSLTSGFLFATNKLIVRSALTKQVNPVVFGAAHELIAGLLLLPIGLYYFSLPHSPAIWMALLLGIFLIFLADLFAFLALEKIQASLYQITNQLRHVIVLFGAYLLFSEPITLVKVISIFLIIFGVYIAIMTKSQFKFDRGTVLAVLSAVCIAIGFLFIKKTTVDVAPAFSASLSLISSGLLISFVMVLKKMHPAKIITLPHRNLLLTAALFFALFEFCLFTALSVGQASKIAPVTQSSLLFTLAGGYLFLHERDRLRQKIIGSVLIAVGICLLYFI